MNNQPISTGLASLDAALGGGLRPGSLTVIAGRTGMGATSLALQIGERIAGTLRKKGWLYTGGSVELNPSDILGNLLRYRDSGTPLPFVICDGPHWSVAMIERALADKPVSSVVIDELLRLAPNRPERYDCPSAAYPAMAQELKHLARALHVPVLCNVRLGRFVEERDDPQPTLEDLSYSCPLGAAVDTVLLLYREDYYCHDGFSRQKKHSDRAEITVTRRCGETVIIPCRWDVRYLRFEESLK